MKTHLLSSCVMYEFDCIPVVKEIPLYLDNVERLFQIISSTYYTFLLLKNYDNPILTPTIERFQEKRNWMPAWAANIPEEMKLEVISISYHSPLNFILSGLKEIIEPLLAVFELPSKIREREARVRQENTKTDRVKVQIAQEQEVLKQLEMATKEDESMQYIIREILEKKNKEADLQVDQMMWKHGVERLEDVLRVEKQLERFMPADAPPELKIAFSQQLILSMVTHSTLSYEISSIRRRDNPPELLSDGS